MEFFETVAARHSYRGSYCSAPVPREHLNAIVEAGCHAPSGCNKQTTSFLVVDDPHVLAQLHEVITSPLGKTAPAMICVLTQKIIAYQDRTFYIQDYSAAIQNALLAITDLGYASCWVEGRVTGPDRVGHQMAKILGVPEDYELIAYLPVGIPAEEVTAPVKMPVSDRVHFNRF